VKVEKTKTRESDAGEEGKEDDIAEIDTRDIDTGESVRQEVQKKWEMEQSSAQNKIGDGIFFLVSVNSFLFVCGKTTTQMPTHERG
jgi:hypothetical protein